MKVIEPSYEILTTKEQVFFMLKITESAGRTCYKSEDRITDDSYKKFIGNIVSRGHLSVVEHCNVTVRIVCDRGISHEIVRHRIGSYCIAGDTKILRFNQDKEHLTIKELYERQNDPQLTGRNKLMLLRSMSEEHEIVPNKFKKIIYSGKKDVYKVITSLGYEIKTTKDHIFFDSNGEIKLKYLSVGDKIFVNGENILKDKAWLYEKYHKEGLSISEIAYISGYSYHTVRKYITTHGIQKKFGAKPKNFKAWNKGLKYGDNPQSDKIIEALLENHHKNGFKENNSNYKKNIEDITNSGKRSRFTKLKKESCAFCGETKNLENHHIDKDINNYSEENKLTLCRKCHKLIHKGYNVKKAILDEITSIEYVGEEETYDIEMNNPYHNFVANGFIVHNSQESSRYVNYSKDKFGNQITVIKPCFWNDKDLDLKKRLLWEESMLEAEKKYFQLLEAGATPEEARSVLPNSTKTEIVMTMNLRSWYNFFELRTNHASHPQIREIAIPLLKDFQRVMPFIFDKIEVK